MTPTTLAPTPAAADPSNGRSAPTPFPAWLRATAVAGLAWNLYGLYQFSLAFTSAGRAAIAAGLTPEQAQLYFGLPGWISGAFAVGVFGGLLGSAALWGRRRWALPVFGMSVAGYALLFAGDVYHGVFAAMPQQLVILAFVVAVAGALLVAAWQAGRRGLLR